MSATNQTPNYDLPQYIGTDVPSYLGDFNSAMLKIDTAMKGVDNKATSAESSVATANANASEAVETAGTASTKADTAQATATQAQSTANSANSTAKTAKSTADTALENANNAQTTASQINTDIEKWTQGNIGANNAQVMYSRNKKLNLLGLSCYVENGQGTTVGNNTIIGTLPTGLRPSQTRTINGACIVYWNDSNSTLIRKLIIKPDGTINCPVENNFNSIMVQCMLCTLNWGMTN